MVKRQITPHKGNRTKSLPGTRITEETAAQITAIREYHKEMTGERFMLADWIAEKVAEEFAKIPKEAKTV
jgi:hypothetical protein